ncbi:MAG: SlyX family protein [Polyangiaceae bacterium]|nr:SlyX family protein [Polyangiaceae bacterium]
MKTDTDRLVDLEVRYTLQQDQLDKLSTVLWEHQRIIERLLARLEHLEGGEGSETSGDLADDVPPHY